MRAFTAGSPFTCEGEPHFFEGLRVVVSGRNEDFSEKLLFDPIFGKKKYRDWDFSRGERKCNDVGLVVF